MRNHVPDALVALIERAHIMERASDPEDGVRLLIKVDTVGHWPWDGVKDAQARLRQAWPELSPVANRRAAKLIHAEIGSRLREMAQGRPKRKPSWVHDYGYPNDIKVM